MKVEIKDANEFASVKPFALTRFLAVNGWKEIRTITGEATVYSKTGRRESSSLVWAPVNDRYSDYSSTVARLIRTVAEVENKSELTILDDLETAALGDVINLRTYDPLDIHQHTIPLEDGASLLNRARQMAYSAAQSALERKPVYYGRPAQQARAFLSNLRLGQTERGSYIVRLISPIDEPEPSAQLSIEVPDMPPLSEPVPFPRRAVIELANGLNALKDAARDNASRGKFYFGSFQDIVDSGVSANLCEALAAKSEELGDFTNKPIEVSIVWSYALKDTHTIDIKPILFEPTTVPYIRQAAREFRSKFPEKITLNGWVKLFGREARQPGPGEIRLLTTIRGKQRTVRVNLTQTDYELALTAHKQGDLITVTGVLAKDGNLNRLSNPEGFAVISEETLAHDDEE